MTMIRIRFNRFKGKPLPPGILWVGRPSRWGNLFSITMFGVDGALLRYRRHVEGMDAVERAAWLAPLLGAEGLACACRLDQPCHADVLIEYLDAATGPADDVPAE